MLAMHMADQLLTPGVAAAFIAISGAMLVLSARRSSAHDDPARVPLMGVLGAFVFAAQMINFPILPGTSGHLGGGVLLAILLGPHAASLVMASILIVQCLIFQDGGLLALGTNILNMGIIPCYLGAAVFLALAGTAPSRGRLYAAVFAATFVGMLAGAAMVPVQAGLSGVLAVPFARFLLAMLGLHVLIALAEAFITFAVIAYVAKVRPQLLGDAGSRLASASHGMSATTVLASLAVAAVLLGGLGSLMASEWPDALEALTSGEQEASPMVRENTSSAVERASDLQSRVALLPDYRWTSFSGVVGAGVTLIALWVIGRALTRRRHASAHEHQAHSHGAGPPA